MKLTLLLLTFLLTFKANANYDVIIQVYDTKGQQARNLPIVLIEKDSKKAHRYFTNSFGKVSIELTPGKWSVNINAMKRCQFIDVPKEGSGALSFMITYNPKHWARLNRPIVNRSSINFQTFNQSKLKKKERPKAGHSFVKLELKQLNKKGLANFPVTLTCYSTKSQFQSKTDKNGEVLFEVPNENDYEIDLESNESFSYVDISKRSGFFTKKFTYQPLQINENELNDTITQEIPIPDDKIASSARAFLKLRVKNYNNDMEGEPVYLKMLKSNKVYKSKIRKDGQALFMLPLHRRYMIDTKYKKEIDVIDYMDYKVQSIVRSEDMFTFDLNYKVKFPERYLPQNKNDFTEFSSEIFQPKTHDQALEYFNLLMQKQYTEPTGEESFGVYLKWASPEINENSKEALLEVGFKAKEISSLTETPKRTKPMNISFVIDVSGSMAGEERLEGVKTALKKMLKKFQPDDIVSITTFNGSATVVAPANIMSRQKLIYDIIDDLRAGGGTNIYEGLKSGYPQLEKHKIANATNRLVLLTDGYGSTPIEKLISHTKTYYKKGFECLAIGVGSGYNEALISQLATVGGGLMYFGGNLNKLNNVFMKEFFSITVPFAEQASIEVYYKKQLVWKQLYGHTATLTQGKANLALANLYRGVNKLMLIKFDLNNPTKEIEKSPVRVIMKYKDIQSGKPQIVKKEERLKWKPSDGSTEYLIEMNKKRIQAVATMNQALKVMAQQHSSGNSKAAQQTLISTKNQIQKIFPNAAEKDIYSMLAVMDDYVKTFELLFNKVSAE